MCPLYVIADQIPEIFLTGIKPGAVGIIVNLIQESLFVFFGQGIIKVHVHFLMKLLKSIKIIHIG